MNVYLLHEEIDLGSHVVGVFSSQQKAESAQALYADWYRARHGFAPRLFVEEHEVDMLGLGYGHSRKTRAL
jgi:hypothetical protein